MEVPHDVSPAFDRGGAERRDVAENPIQRLLDERHFPWRETQASLIERYGVGRDPWFEREEIVLVDNEAPLVPALLRPLHFARRPIDNPFMPPLRLRGWAWARRGRWWRSRAMATLEMLRESLEPALGSPAKDNSSNTRGWGWRFGPASIRMTAFPPVLSLQPSAGIPVPDRRDPRVDQSCWIDIVTGYRPACTPRERAWIEAFEPWSLLSGSGNPKRVAANPPRQEVLEYVREPLPGFERTLGRIGRTADGEALIIGSDQLHIVPTGRVDHVHVDRIAPARGSGGSSLSVACRGAFGDQPVRHISLASDPDCDGLSDVAGRLAEWLGRPCVLGDYEPDY